jgi:hypothetical protein
LNFLRPAFSRRWPGVAIAKVLDGIGDTPECPATDER